MIHKDEILNWLKDNKSVIKKEQDNINQWFKSGEHTLEDIQSHLENVINLICSTLSNMYRDEDKEEIKNLVSSSIKPKIQVELMLDTDGDNAQDVPVENQNKETEQILESQNEDSIYFIAKQKNQWSFLKIKDFCISNNFKLMKSTGSNFSVDALSDNKLDPKMNYCIMDDENCITIHNDGIYFVSGYMDKDAGNTDIFDKLGFISEENPNFEQHII